MEKIIYLARFSATPDSDQGRQQDVDALSRGLIQANGVHGLTLQLEDSDVADAAALRIESIATLPQLVVSLWVDSANAHDEYSTVIAQYAEAVEGYLVSESAVLNPGYESGQRGAGFTQVCCFRTCKGLDQPTFVERWRGQHTDIALRSQSTFGYRQNLVVAKLTPSAPDWAAIVEEHFPAAAMSSPAVFFNAEGDAEKLKDHQRDIAESCARFIDFQSINVVHMSEYVVKQLPVSSSS